MYRILEVASNISTPIALAGLVFATLFLIARKIVEKTPAVGSRNALKVMLTIINRFFVLSLVAMCLGFVGYLFTTFLDKAPNLVPLLQQHQQNDQNAVALKAELDKRQLALDETKQITALYDRRRELNQEWRRLYDEYSRLHQAQRGFSSPETDRISHQIAEISQHISSIDDSLAELERKSRDDYRQLHPPLAPSDLGVSVGP